MPFSIWFLNFRTRLTNWEYWPFEVVYLPVFGYWLWLSLKARSLFFFSAANPSIATGGMLGESKFQILEKIDDSIKPKTLLVEVPSGFQEVLADIRTKGIHFPMIAKPDVGERGWKVEKIHTETELRSYHRAMRINYLIQAYVDEPVEIGLFYYRFPGKKQGVISSIVRKEFLTLTGDGQSTIQNLIAGNERARLQYDVLTQRYPERMGEVLAAGEETALVPIGNHCRGTKFLNGNHLITPQLQQVFDHISQSIDGFYYGRYDIRCQSLEDLYAGKIKILELNGAGAEPAHIYDPGFSFWEAYRVLFRHWRVLYQISRANHRSGTAYMTFGEGIHAFAKVRSHRKQSQFV